MSKRTQTRTNRHLGVNAGRQRREAQANRQEASANLDRRRQVYRDDVEYAGLEPADVARRKREARARRVVELRALELSFAQIAFKIGISVQTARRDWTDAGGKPGAYRIESDT